MNSEEGTAVAGTKKVVDEDVAGTAMVWALRKGGHLHLQMPHPCRRENVRQVAGMFMLPATSNIRRCRPNRLVSSHAMF